MPLTILDLIEETDTRTPEFRVIIGGATLPTVASIDYAFSMGQVPTATITVPSRAYLPAAVREEASVQIWFGLRSGISMLEQLVYGGAVVDSVSSNGQEIVIECVMSGPRKLSYGYNRRISYDFEDVTAYESIVALLVLAGVSNYYVDSALFEPWVIGTVVPYTIDLGNEIQFTTYGDIINKIAEVDGSPWYAMPSGQVRVELRDPVPSPSARRTYYSGVLTGIVESQPLSITNPDARPRIVDISRRKYRSEVANFIEVNGAVVSTIGPLGEVNSNQIVENVDGLSGSFPSGARWIPDPPSFQDFTFSNELIDENSKAFSVAERYFELKNRLMEKIPLSIPGDPDVFLGETIKVVDPRYSGVESLYFVEGYRTAADQGGCVTELQLTGGPESGTTGYASPFADFIWKYQALHQLTPGGYGNMGQNNTGSDPGAKLCEDLPAETGDSEQGGDYTAGTDRRTVIIGLDGTVSEDFDGYIVDWEWTYTDYLAIDRTLNGSRVTIVVDPDLVDSIEMTLTVTDNSGRTSDITKTIYTSADYIDPNTGLPANDPTQDDTDNGGGTDIGCCDPDTEDCGPPEDPDSPPEDPENEGPGPNPSGTLPGTCNGMGAGYFIAAGTHAMGTTDNRTWNDLTPGDVGAGGEFISVAAGVNYVNQTSYALFGTSAGDIVKSEDICVTGSVIQNLGSAVNVIVFDMNEMGIPQEGTNWDGTIPVYTQGSPGTMTIMEAYQQALAVGFSQSPAVIAVAVMMAESGLYSAASNTAGNNPPSEDRGIAQINDYYHPNVSDAQAFNTFDAITYMFTLSQGGADFTPWTAYNAGTYQQFLSQVQDAVGVIIDPNAPPGSGSTMVKKHLKLWAGCADGKVWVSVDSGNSWSIWSTAGYPIYVIITPPFPPPAGAPSLWVFGGDSGDFNSLILRATAEGRLEAVVPQGVLRNALILVGPGHHISAAAFNSTALAIGFSGGLIPPLWTSSDPLGDPTSWIQAVGIAAGSVESIAQGFDSEFIVA